MPEMTHTPTDPSDPVEVPDIQSPEDLSAFSCEQFDAIHGPEWTAHLWSDPPRPEAYKTTDRNVRAAAFLYTHASNGRTDWGTPLRGPPVLAVCRPALTADPLPSPLAPYLEDPSEAAAVRERRIYPAQIEMRSHTNTKTPCLIRQGA